MSDANTTPPATGRPHRGSLRLRTHRTLVTNAPNTRHPDDRVDRPPGVDDLVEADRPQALIRDGQRHDERQRPRQPVRLRHPRLASTLRALSEEPTTHPFLEDGERGRQGGEPHLELRLPTEEPDERLLDRRVVDFAYAPSATATRPPMPEEDEHPPQSVRRGLARAAAARRRLGCGDGCSSGAAATSGSGAATTSARRRVPRCHRRHTTPWVARWCERRRRHARAPGRWLGRHVTVLRVLLLGHDLPPSVRASVRALCESPTGGR